MSMLGNKKLHQATKETDSAVVPASRSAAGPSWFSGLPRLRAFTRHVSVLPTIEASAASATATTTRLSWLLGFLALAGHVPRLAAVEAVSATSTATAFPRLSAVSRHVTVLATVEAALAAATAASAAVATSAALLAPADSNSAATNLVTIEVRDSLLSMLFLVEVDETEGSLYD